MSTQNQKYDAGKTPMGLLSTTALTKIAKVMAFGAQKYSVHQWRSGMNWQRVLDAALRHLLAYNDGKNVDDETGLSHLAHLGCCVMFLLEYEETHPELDNRYKADEEVPGSSMCGSRHIFIASRRDTGVSELCFVCSHSRRSDCHVIA